MKKKDKSTFTRASAHTLKFTNQEKQNQLRLILQEARRVTQSIVDRIWEQGLRYGDVNFDVKSNKLKCPSFVDSTFLSSEESWFTARMIKLCGTHACSAIRAAVKKRSKQLFMLKKLQRAGSDTRKLQRKIDLFPLIKPNATNMNFNFDMMFANIQDGKHFDLFV
jgi:hypothetical protein